MSRIWRRRRPAGFTLIEVVIALAILGVALLGLLQVIGNSTRAASHVYNKTIAHFVGENVLAMVRVAAINDKKPQKLPEQGQQRMLQRVWFWQLKRGQADALAVVPVSIQVRAEPAGAVITVVNGFIAS